MAFNRKILWIDAKWKAVLYPVARWANTLELYRSIDRQSQSNEQPHFIFLYGHKEPKNSTFLDTREAEWRPGWYAGDAAFVHNKDWIVTYLHGKKLHRERKWLADAVGTEFLVGPSPHVQVDPAPAPVEFLWDNSMGELLGEPHPLLLDDSAFRELAGS